MVRRPVAGPRAGQHRRLAGFFLQGGGGRDPAVSPLVLVAGSASSPQEQAEKSRACQPHDPPQACGEPAQSTPIPSLLPPRTKPHLDPSRRGEFSGSCLRGTPCPDTGRPALGVRGDESWAERTGRRRADGSLKVPGLRPGRCEGGGDSGRSFHLRSREAALEGGGRSGRQWAWPAVARAGPRPAPGAYPVARDLGLPAARRPSVSASSVRASTHGCEGAVAAAAVVAGRGGARWPPAAVRPHPRRPGAALSQGACSGTPAPCAVRRAAGHGAGEPGGEARSLRGCPRPQPALGSGLGRVGSRPLVLLSCPGPTGRRQSFRGAAVLETEVPGTPWSRSLSRHGRGPGVVSLLPGCNPWTPQAPGRSGTGVAPGGASLGVGTRLCASGAGAQGTCPTCPWWSKQSPCALEERRARWEGWGRQWQRVLVLNGWGWARSGWPPGVQLAPLTLY